MPDNGKFCPYCGIDNSQQEPPAEETAQSAVTEEEIPAQPQQDETVETVPNVKKKKRLAAISGCIALMAVLALVLFIGFKGVGNIGGNWNIAGWFDWEIFRDNDIYKQDSYTVSDKKAEKKADNVVATLGDAELTNGRLQVYYWMQVYDFMSQYSYYISYVMDLSTPLDQQDCALVEGMTWQQFFLEEALASWKRYETLYEEAEAANFELPEEYRTGLNNMESNMQTSAAQNGYESVEAMMQGEFGAGATFDDYMYYLERYYVGNLYFNEVMDKVEVTAEEMETYFQANQDTLAKSDITKDSGLLLDIRKILIKPEGTKDESGNTVYTDEAWETAREKAQAILDQYLAGEKTQDAFSALATEKSGDSTTASSGGLMQHIGKWSVTTIDVRHILIEAEGTDNADGTITFKDEQKAADAKAKAEEILAKWLENPTEEYFGELANENSADNNGKVTNGGIYENVTEGQMVANFNNWCFDESRQSGDYAIVETKFGYHIMYFVHRDDALEQWAFADGRQAGDTTLVKTDDGYVILYYVTGEEGWIVYSRNGVLTEKSSKLLEEYENKKTMEVTYRKIALGAVSLSSGTATS